MIAAVRPRFGLVIWSQICLVWSHLSLVMWSHPGLAIKSFRWTELALLGFLQKRFFAGPKLYCILIMTAVLTIDDDLTLGWIFPISNDIKLDDGFTLTLKRVKAIHTIWLWVPLLGLSEALFLGTLHVICFEGARFDEEGSLEQHCDGCEGPPIWKDSHSS